MHAIHAIPKRQGACSVFWWGGGGLGGVGLGGAELGVRTGNRCDQGRGPADRDGSSQPVLLELTVLVAHGHHMHPVIPSRHVTVTVMGDRTKGNEVGKSVNRKPAC